MSETALWVVQVFCSNHDDAFVNQYSRAMTSIDIHQAAEGQKIDILLDEDQSDAISNGERVQFVIGTDFVDDGVEDGRSVVEIRSTTKFSD